MFRYAWIAMFLCAPVAMGEPIGPMPHPGVTDQVAEQTITKADQDTGAAGEVPARSERPLGSPPAAQPSKGGTGSSQPVGARGWLTGTALPLLGVLGLIVALAWVYRRFARTQGGISSAFGAGGHAPSGVLSVLGRFPVGGGMTLVLLQLDRRVLLVSHSAGSMFRGRPGSMSLLSEITDEESVASLLVRTQDERGESMSQRFNELLQGYSLEDADEFHANGGLDDVPAVSLVDEVADDGDEARQELSPLRRRLDRLMRHPAAEKAAS